jgi:hypothetical protein
MNERNAPQPSADRKKAREEEALALQGQLAFAYLKSELVSKWADANPAEADWLLERCSNWLLEDVHGLARSLIRWGDLSDRQMNHIRAALNMRIVK